MPQNELHGIFLVLKKFHESENIGKTIHEVSTFSQQLNIRTYIPELNDYVKVFKEVHIGNLFFKDPYLNPTFSSTLVVFSKGEEKRWLVLKQSTIKDSGLGVFAARTFKKNEFVSCYLGEYQESVMDITYHFKEINGRISTESGQFVEDFWFGHRIQHGSGDRVNVSISKTYVIKAIKKVEVGQELFLDYNRDVPCSTCKEDRLCDDKALKSTYPCTGCKKRVNKGKICGHCNRFFLCYNCYDKTQI